MLQFPEKLENVLSACIANSLKKSSTSEKLCISASIQIEITARNNDQQFPYSIFLLKWKLNAFMHGFDKWRQCNSFTINVIRSKFTGKYIVFVFWV